MWESYLCNNKYSLRSFNLLMNSVPKIWWRSLVWRKCLLIFQERNHSCFTIFSYIQHTIHCIVNTPFLDIFSISIPLFFFPCSIAFDMTDAIQKQFNMECDIEGNEFSVKKSINGISIAVKCTIGKVLSSCCLYSVFCFAWFQQWMETARNICHIYLQQRFLKSVK